MRKPEKPLPADCCGSGCVRCVYDVYLEHKTKYEAWKRKNGDSEIDDDKAR